MAVRFAQALILICLTTTIFACQAIPVITPTLQATPTTRVEPSRTVVPSATLTATPLPTSTPTLTPTATPSPSPTPRRAVPQFEHILMIFLENKEFITIIDRPGMPNFNRWAKQYTLLTQHYAITHPSLPNYIALIGGDTHKVTTSYPDFIINAPSLPDLIEKSGRTWKAYMESMPEPCGLKDTLQYVLKHNPFVYYAPIRNNPERCKRSIVPLTELERDLQKGELPHYAFIMPNMCNSAHDCDLNVADDWLNVWVNRLMKSPALGDRYLLILTWDEGQGELGCCGMAKAGGRVPTILISPLARAAFQDSTPYTHYSLLKTISAAWDLPELGQAAATQTALITAPWK